MGVEILIFLLAGAVGITLTAKEDKGRRKPVK